jgi:DNA-binding beta-propeller fold protein YncE
VARKYRGFLVKRICSVFLFLTLVLLFSFFLPAPPALADGGAPNLAYVAGTASGVSVIDIAQRKVTGTLPISGDSGNVLLSVDGRLLYVTQPAAGRITAIATKTGQVLCSSALPGRPTLLALDPGTNTLYVAGTGANRVTALDPMTCAVRHVFTVHDNVSGMAVALVGQGIAGGNGNQLWVTETSGLNVFQPDGKHLARLSLPEHPQHLCIPPGTTAYVSTQEGEVRAIDLNTRHVSPALLTGGIFGPMDYDASTGEVYVPNLHHHQIAVLSPVRVNDAVGPKEPRRRVNVASAPQAVAITSDGQLGFIALEDGNVAMLDVPARQIITTIHIGGRPHCIITGLYPSLLALTPQQFSLVTLLLNSLHSIAAVIILLTAIVAIAVQRYRRRPRSGPTSSSD